MVNDEEHHSLWLALTDVPAGWWLVYGVADRTVFRDYSEQNRNDIGRRVCVRSWQQPAVDK